MLKSQFTLLAEYVREGTQGKMDLLGVFDRVFAKDVPAQHDRMTFVALIIGENEDDVGKKSMRFTLTAPSGGVVIEQRAQAEIKIANDSTWFASARMMFQIVGLPLPEFGRYRFALEIGGREVTSHALTVVSTPK